MSDVVVPEMLVLRLMVFHSNALNVNGRGTGQGPRRDRKPQGFEKSIRTTTNLKGELYLDFLQTQLPNYLDALPLPLRQNMLFMRDGAPAHFSRLVAEARCLVQLEALMLIHLISVYGVYMKSLVYEHEINTREELWQKINNAAVSLRNK
ncbi:hypothetical protein NQ318_005254 [Aromia moschata]|uniref:Transposase n=1 Tax=Aromia moschata TaxID=1265417 RepID=A0AAV8Y118_9CUCU|nr:hypothetical protein NQ318_005254 [Aromia moschata]